MDTRFETAYKLFHKVKRISMLASGLAVFIMMFYTTIDVALRNIFGLSILYSYEITQFYLMPLAVFPALAFTFGEGIMPRMGMLVEKLKEKYQLKITVLFILIEIGIMLLLTWYGFQYFMNSLAKGETFTAGTNYFPLSYVIFFVPIGFLLVAIEMSFLLMKNLQDKKPVFRVVEK